MLASEGLVRDGFDLGKGGLSEVQISYWILVVQLSQTYSFIVG